LKLEKITRDRTSAVASIRPAQAILRRVAGRLLRSKTVAVTERVLAALLFD
jgi:hypothetical protein